MIHQSELFSVRLKTYLLTLLLLFSFALQGKSRLPDGIQSGDLVFRDGGEVISAIIKGIDSSGYSHVGMIYLSGNDPQVIHATPKEHPQGNDAVIIDSLEFFRSRAKNQHIAFYHVKANPQQHATALSYALKQIDRPFGFDEHSQYCTQLVYDAWKKAGITISNNQQRLKVPLLKTPIILPQQITSSAAVQAVEFPRYQP